MNEELVSVIMTTYNTGKFLAGSVESILSQTYRNLELLITDDGSSDTATLETLHQLEKQDERVKVEYLTENHGPGYARNCSIKRARGRYISFCDSDDRWTSDKLSTQLAFMQQKACALSCTSYILCDEEGEEFGLNIPPQTITFSMMKRDNKVGCLTAIYDTKRLGRKFFMPHIRKRQDWGLFLSIVRECGVCYAYTERPLAYYCSRVQSVSSGKFSLVKYNVAIYREILGFNKLKAYFYFFFLFLPSYTLKIMKRKRDSKHFLDSKRQAAAQAAQ